MEGYKAELIKGSREFTKTEKILVTMGTHTALDEQLEMADVEVNLDWWALVKVYNEKSDNKEYEIFLLKDKSGLIFHTSSQSFYVSFMNIWDIMTDDMEDKSDPGYSIICKRKESKNYKGKFFFTCDIVV